MNLELLLGLIPGLIHFTAFLIYNKQMLKGESRPNTTTWTLWSVIATLNCISYIYMSGDAIKGVIAITGSILCVGTLMLSLVKGKLSKLNRWDIYVLMVGVVAVIFWWIFRSATYGNLILQACFLISFIPTYKYVIKNPKNEKGLPWFIWGFAYLVAICIVLLRWNNQYQDLVYPILSCVTHGGLGFLTLRKLK